MRKSMMAVLLVAQFLIGSAATATEPGRIGGDPAKAGEVWSTFEHWLTAYSGGDLTGVMAIFDHDLVFSFQGSKDQGYDAMRASYDQDFHTRKGQVEWVPTVEEVYADGHMAIVRSIWELKVTADGKQQIRARNRSMDVFHQGGDGQWRIVRSINYPEKAG